MEKETWIANCYITEPTSDRGKTRIPMLKSTNEDGTTTEHTTNEEKSRLFAQALFPNLPAESTVPTNYDYPDPLPTTESSLRNRYAATLQG